MGRISLKRHVGQLYALMHERDTRRKIILLYHSVGGGDAATAIETFRAHVNVIATMGEVLALRNMVDCPPDRGIAVAITFDDGYAALRDHASAILVNFGCAATAFLNVSEIADKDRRLSRAEDGYYPGEHFLTWRDVDALVGAGWHIGSHGVRHLDLVSVDSATAEDELSTSKLMIEQRLGTTCDMFAYPWGRNNGRLRSRARSAGYRYGFAGGHCGLTPGCDPFALPRINVAKEYSRDDLIAILRGDWDYLDWVVKAKAVMG
jgi:peptidoglycan/xylan/chitin deacetylase (PgdA/CDA1 family)